MTKGGAGKNVDDIVEIGLKNFGPIQSSDISLCPLTLFIGPNRSGKSFNASAIYSILSTLETLKNTSIYETPSLLRRNIRQIFLSLNKSIYAKLLYSWIDDLREPGDYELPEKLLKGIKNSVKRVIHSMIEHDLRRIFVDGMDTLVRCSPTTKKENVRKKTFNITFKYNQFFLRFKYNEERDKATTSLNIKNVKSSVRILKRKSSTHVSIDFTRDESSFSSLAFNKPEDASQAGFLFMMVVMEFISGYIDTPFDKISYLPAARSGILQSFGSITIGAIEQQEKNQEREILPGIISDFIQSIMRFSGKKGNLSSIVDTHEKSILDGGNIIINRKENSIPEFLFASNTMLVPIHNASSSVAEIAPLFVFLDFQLTSNSLLIIEEPEAHLDSLNQTKLANFIVDLVKAGLRIVVTTHSDFFISALNNYIRKGFLEEKRKGNQFLESGSVKPYMFSRNGSVEEIPLTVDEGISEEQFAVIRRKLFDEALDIDIAMRDRK